MAFIFTEEQRELRGLARRYLREAFPFERVAALADSDEGWDQSSWDELAAMDWLGVTVPEEHGGVGLGFVEQAILLEELGRVLYPGPYLATVAALPALGPAQWGEVAAGKKRWSIEVDGLVPDLDLVDHVVTEDGEADAEGELLASIDPTRRVGRLRDLPRRSLPGTVDRAVLLVALAAEALGVAQRALDVAVEYATERHQFGRAIGSYQAIAHPLAGSFSELELARSLVYAAAWRVSADPAGALRAATMAKAFTTDAAVTAAERAIQVHGGIGFTWEHPLHRYYKRALWLQGYAGSPSRLRAGLRESVLSAPS